MGLHMGSLVWGVRDVARAQAFWQEALGFVPRREPDDDWVVLVPPDGGDWQLALMQVSSPAAHRHHLDLYADDRDAEVERLIGLGATRVDDWDYEEGADYTVLADLDGNPFCVCDPYEPKPA